GSPPRFIRALVDDVTQLSNASRLSRSTASDPARGRATAAPAAGGETQYLRLDPAALKHPAEQLGANGSGGDRGAAHRAGVIDKQRYHRIGKCCFTLLLVGQWLKRVGDQTGQPRGIQQPLIAIKFPGA